MNKMMQGLITRLVIAGVLAGPGLLSAETTVPVLSLPDMEHWEANEFDGMTRYTRVNINGKQALKAVSQAGASGYSRKIDIDLTQTPWLNWHWRVDNILQNLDEKTKQGDDYPARVYVVVSGGLFFWNTRALNYVWSSSQPVQSVWPNAFTENATLVAVQSGAKNTGQWVSEKRNILLDIKKHLGIDVTEINAVAIMTDTDNSKQSATAYYGDIYFSSE